MGTNRDDFPCSATPGPSGWCRWHDPALADERARWRREGGQARSNKARARKALPSAAMTPSELQAFLIVVMRGVLAGRVDKGVGNCIGNLSRSIAALYPVADFADRLAAIERRDGRPA
jgi:hypothetical protein